MSTVKISRRRSGNHASVSDSPMTMCLMGKTCPNGFRRNQISETALACGIDAKRNASHRNPGTLKSVSELCAEILPIANDLNDLKSNVDGLISAINDEKNISLPFHSDSSSILHRLEPILAYLHYGYNINTDETNKHKKLLSELEIEFHNYLRSVTEKLILIQNVENTIIREVDVYNDRNGPIARDLRRLLNNLQKDPNPDILSYQHTFDEILDNIRFLGRRCANKMTPISDESVDEIPEEDWIRLSNGACWDIDTLIDYIKNTTNGENTIEKIRRHMPSYPISDHIWINNRDYLKIINHPKARAARLQEFIIEREIRRLATLVSNDTMNVLYKEGSILWSRGPPFNIAIAEIMTPIQLVTWNNLSYNMTDWELPDEIFYSRPDTIERDILTLINGPIKTQSIIRLHQYYQGLSSDEKNVLEMLSPDIEEYINNCHAGEYCVMQLGEKLIRLYNKLIPYKT